MPYRAWFRAGCFYTILCYVMLYHTSDQAAGSYNDDDACMYHYDTVCYPKDYDSTYMHVT